MNVISLSRTPITRHAFRSALSCCLGMGLLLLCGYGSPLKAQTCRDASVELSATVQADPPRILLSWVPNAGTNTYTIHRKSKTSATWGVQMASLPGDAFSYLDTTVQKGIPYEYRVVRNATSYNGYGYILSGIEVPAIEDRGRLVLVIDDTLQEPLAFEISRLISDMEGDGWRVIPHYVSRDTTAQAVREIIKNTYLESPSFTRAAFLLGRVPVPYSGDLYPDGHPDHEGAWPADVYYADMNGTWTDAAVTIEVANDSRHHNVPGDGKLDQSLIPSDVELQVGRVDFFNMPAFANSETELVRQYLDKDHAYRHGMMDVRHRAIVDDNFGYFSGEAFAASGWKNFAPLVSPDSIMAADYFTTLNADSYQWSYGCGGGWYQGAGGVGSTSDFAAGNVKSVFTILFGSYFGDWDAQNNFLRAPLARGTTLTNVWSGRPHWQFHHMGLGENIGYSTRLTQNNTTLYYSSYGGHFVHQALMGDPTLRQHVLPPPADLQADMHDNGVQLTWEPSPRDDVRYHIYLQLDTTEAFTRLTTDPVAETTFDVTCIGGAGHYTFMVRAMELQTSPSGSYYNLSQGIFASVDHPGTPEVIANATWAIVGSDVVFVNFSQNATSYLWVFGDGQSSTESGPTHAYLDGTFMGYLVAYSDCGTDTLFFDIDIFTGIADLQDDPTLHLTPNPVHDRMVISWDPSGGSAAHLDLFAETGQRVWQQEAYRNGEVLDLVHLPAGVYTLYAVVGDTRSVRRLVIQH